MFLSSCRWYFFKIPSFVYMLNPKWPTQSLSKPLSVCLRVCDLDAIHFLSHTQHTDPSTFFTAFALELPPRQQILQSAHYFLLIFNE
ncbi:hypothetical protein KC327_g73 [Hortaea werneckii]|nr:hypothetical protein KC327_g73 [Hortaea werneckii]